MWNNNNFFIIVVLLLIAAIGGSVLPSYMSKPLEGVDAIVVYKQKRLLEVWFRNKVIRTYPVSLGGNPSGAKQREGDMKTPEGKYTIDWQHPNSSYYKALHISYPNAYDILHVNQGVNTGGDIMIHGMPNGLGALYPILRYFDWTQGCIAISNVAMEELSAAIKNGTPMTIYP